MIPLFCLDQVFTSGVSLVVGSCVLVVHRWIVGSPDVLPVGQRENRGSMSGRVARRVLSLTV